MYADFDKGLWDINDAIGRLNEVIIWVVFLAVLGLGWGGPPGSELCDMTLGVVGGVGGSRKIARMRVGTEDFGILIQ